MCILLTIFLMYVIMSFAEWYIHKNIMHAKWYLYEWVTKEKHQNHLLHHYRYYKVFDCEPDVVGRQFNIKFDYIVNALVASPVIVAFVLLGSASAWTAFGCVLAHTFFWNQIHNEMHNPSKVFWARTRLFQYLRENHRLHHEFRGKNYNVVCPLFDWIMGTKVQSVRSRGACGVR